MNRRSFLSALFATAALDPERLLWTPGQKTIFIPPAPTFQGPIMAIDYGEEQSYAGIYYIDSGGVLWLVDEKITPLTQRAPGYEFTIVGAYQSQLISKEEFHRRYPDSITSR